jgi:hypothetical protein
MVANMPCPVATAQRVGPYARNRHVRLRSTFRTNEYVHHMHICLTGKNNQYVIGHCFIDVSQDDEWTVSDHQAVFMFVRDSIHA